MATRDRPFQFTLRGLLLLFVLCAVFMGLVVAGRRNAEVAECSNRLKNIGITLHNYHTATGNFPSAFIANRSGKKIQGWRMHVSPYMIEYGYRGSSLLFPEGHAWDSPSTQAHAAKMSFLNRFKCAIHSNEKPDTTNYLAITGPDTAWPGEQSVRLGDIKDGPSNTILIVEVPDSDVHWMEPRDLNFAGLEKAVKKHGGLRVLFADGRVGFIPASIPRDQLKSLVTIAGGEEIDEQYLPRR